jgi:hypothetical protein
MYKVVAVNHTVKVRHSGITKLGERVEMARQSGQVVPFDEKLELMIFGSRFSLIEWSKEWSGEELETLWRQRDWGALSRVASLAEAKWQMREASSEANKSTRDAHWNLTKVLLPDIWKNAEERISSNEFEESELKEFSINRLILDFSSKSYLNEGCYEVTESRTRVTQEALWELLNILPLCRVAKHPLHAGVLSLSRRALYEPSDLSQTSLISTPADPRVLSDKWIEHQSETRPGGVIFEHRPEGDDSPYIKNTFQRFERYTVMSRLTSDEMSKLLSQNGLPSDPSHIRNACKLLGLCLKPGGKGPKAKK